MIMREDHPVRSRLEGMREKRPQRRGDMRNRPFGDLLVSYIVGGAVDKDRMKSLGRGVGQLEQQIVVQRWIADLYRAARDLFAQPGHDKRARCGDRGGKVLVTIKNA